jgi:hypothetical protein
MKTKHRSFTFQGRTLAALETAHFSAVQDRLESEVFRTGLMTKKWKPTTKEGGTPTVICYTPKPMGG